MTTLIFIRHGETEGNRSGRWQGHADVPLSDEGREQARRLAARLKSEGHAFDGLYASDLGRALETAQIVAQELGLEVHPLVELREIHVGDWSGLTTDEIRTRFPEQWDLFESGGDFRRGGHGESLAEFQARIVQAIAQMVKTHPDQRLLVATHGGAIRVIFYYVGEIMGQRQVEHIENTSLTEVVFEDGVPRIRRATDISHLEPAATSGLSAPA